MRIVDLHSSGFESRGASLRPEISQAGRHGNLVTNSNFKVPASVL